MNDDATERLRLTRLVHDAVARGQAALGAGDRDEATRWLERAHRLAPADGTVTLFLASALIGDDKPKAANLFAQVAEAHDVRDAWLGLATTRLLMGDLPAVRAALSQVLSRHALWPDIIALADGVARAAGAPGWCGLTGEGVLVVHRVGEGEIDIRVDGKALARQNPPSPARHGPPPIYSGEGHLDQHDVAGDDPVKRDRDEAGPEIRLTLPPSWPLVRSIMVRAASGPASTGHFIGSPISPNTIGQIEGFVEATDRGLRGWAWCPNDPDTDPLLSVGTGRTRRDIVATKPADAIPGLAPLARPRSFAIRWTELPGANTANTKVRGRDGRDLSTRRPRASPGPAVPSPPHWHDKAIDTVILVTHHDGGGVERRVQTSVAAHESQGRRAIVLRPLKRADGTAGVVVEAPGLPASRFELPREQPALLRFLRQTKPIEAELHHFLNHDPSVFQTIQALGIPYDAHTHDYAWFCPRIALVGRGNRYCGEPEPAACEACVAETGSFLHEDIRIPALLERSRHILSGARRIIAPSPDAAARMERHFPGLLPTVIPHEDDDAMDEPPPIPLVTEKVRVCLAGAIGLHKGFHVLLACARDARKRDLDLTFVVAGTTINDQRLIDTGRVFVTGPYQPDEAADLIRAQNAALALFPSIWPETWCLGLTELWRAGLRVAAFDIGAPAERIRNTGRGFLLPLGLSPPRINDALLNAARGRSFLPIRRSSAYKPSH